MGKAPNYREKKGFTPPLKISRAVFGAKRQRFPRTGFTLIELLVVVAIVGLLSSLVLVSIASTRAKARDVEREAEIKSLQNALSIYVANRRVFPIYAGTITGADSLSVDLKNEGALSSVPLDPFNTGSYVYSYSSIDGSTYVITYYLETNTIPGKPCASPPCQYTAEP